jgi:rubrerythrin
MKCGQCGGKLRRVHRSFLERFSYMAIYECRKCEREEFAPRRYRYHLGPSCRCPVCGSYRVVKLKRPDRIDRMHTGFLNFVEKIVGKNQLFHCRWCRLQFYDRRPLAPDGKPPESAPEAPTAADPAQ